MTYKEKIIDLATGEETIRPFTKNEITKVENEIAEVAQRKSDAESIMAAKKAVLSKLGITPEEAELLLG